MSSEDEPGADSIKAALQSVRDMRLRKNKKIFFDLYYYCLTQFGKSDSYRNYLINERKLSEFSIEKFDLFYVGNYNQVNNHLKRTFKLEDLQRSGLFNEKGNMIFYNHRIIIPYKWKNEIVYLRARYFDQDCSPKTDQSKYLGLINDELNLNTPKRFYNVDVIEKLLPGEFLYITEGELDAIMMGDLGYNAVGIPGVGNMPSHFWLKRLFPFKVILVLDNDEAGKLLGNKLQKFFEYHRKPIFEKRLEAKDVSELVKGLS